MRDTAVRTWSLWPMACWTAHGLPKAKVAIRAESVVIMYRLKHVVVTCKLNQEANGVFTTKVPQEGAARTPLPAEQHEAAARVELSHASILLQSANYVSRRMQPKCVMGSCLHAGLCLAFA